MAQTQQKPNQFVLNIERIFDAPRERVFRAWIDAEDALQWGGPRDYPLVRTAADIRPGGKWHSVLRSVEDGQELPQGGVYKEIKEPELLVFTFAWEIPDEENFETLVTIRFEELAGGKTKMSFKQEPFNTEGNRDGHNEGWNSAFDRLEEFLSSN